MSADRDELSHLPTISPAAGMRAGRAVSDPATTNQRDSSADPVHLRGGDLVRWRPNPHTSRFIWLQSSAGVIIVQAPECSRRPDIQTLDVLVERGRAAIVARNINSEQQAAAVAHETETAPEDRPPLSTYGPVDHFVADRIRSQTVANEFLASPYVGHPLGSQHCAIAYLVLRDGGINGDIVALATVENRTNPAADDGTSAQLSRLAVLPTTPKNTASRLLGVVKQWAALAGFRKLVTHSGVGANDGTIYKAAEFEPGPITERSTDWGNRDGRTVVDNFERQRWTYEPTVNGRQPVRPTETYSPETTLADFTPDITDGAPASTWALARYDRAPDAVSDLLDTAIDAAKTPPNTSHTEEIQKTVESASGTENPADHHALFGAVHAPTGTPIALAPVTRPLWRCDRRVTIDGLVTHPSVDHAANLGSWLFARIRDWAQLLGAPEAQPTLSAPAIDPDDSPRRLTSQSSITHEAAKQASIPHTTDTADSPSEETTPIPATV
ncbi:hypothetical protein RYH80_18070 [Halobaculum sp. MBLA0147]|uniref:hypothetical protein n=1 Tax=Halobaculum sp. MBLA0147 TaxID=3079934 RepID=UPI003526C035